MSKTQLYLSTNNDGTDFVLIEAYADNRKISLYIDDDDGVYGFKVTPEGAVEYLDTAKDLKAAFLWLMGEQP